MSRSIGLVSDKRILGCGRTKPVCNRQRRSDWEEWPRGHVYIHHSFGKILREKKRKTCGVKFEREVGMRDFSLMGYVFRMREKTQI